MLPAEIIRGLIPKRHIVFETSVDEDLVGGLVVRYCIQQESDVFRGDVFY